MAQAMPCSSHRSTLPLGHPWLEPHVWCNLDPNGGRYSLIPFSPFPLYYQQRCWGGGGPGPLVNKKKDYSLHLVGNLNKMEHFRDKGGESQSKTSIKYNNRVWQSTFQPKSQVNVSNFPLIFLTKLTAKEPTGVLAHSLFILRWLHHPS